jgi:hypothetical protein
VEAYGSGRVEVLLVVRRHRVGVGGVDQLRVLGPILRDQFRQ